MRRGTGHPITARSGRNGAAAKRCSPADEGQDLAAVGRQYGFGARGGLAAQGEQGFCGLLAQGLFGLAAQGLLAVAHGFFAAHGFLGPQGLLGEQAPRVGAGLHGPPLFAL